MCVHLKCSQESLVVLETVVLAYFSSVFAVKCLQSRSSFCPSSSPHWATQVVIVVEITLTVMCLTFFFHCKKKSNHVLSFIYEETQLILKG